MKIKPVKPKTEVTFRTNANANRPLIFSKWWEEKDKDKAAVQMIGASAYLKEMQSYRYRQAVIYARLYGNHNLFSFAGSNLMRFSSTTNLPPDRPTFNLIQSAIDTLVSRICQSRPQPVFLTDAGDYKQRNLAKKLNNFVAGELYQTKAYALATEMFKDALIQGTGALHIFEGQDNKIALERVYATELLTDPNESIYGDPRRMYRLKLIDREILCAMFPNKEKTILKAAQAFPDENADSSKTTADQVMCVEAWSLPSGPDTGDGKHIIACSAGALLYEDYSRPWFPFVFLHYNQRPYGFWAQGIAEQLMGTQMTLNDILYTISRAIRLVGVPRVFQDAGSKVNKAHHNNEIGVIITYTGNKPSYEVAPCNAPELYAERDKLIQYGYQQCGVSALQATSQKPAGLNSGEAIRSYDDIATDRFNSLARAYDNVFVDLTHQFIDLAKEIAEREGKYESIYPGKDAIRRIEFPKIDWDENPFVVQCYTQSSLPKDPAGRLQKITEMIQAGMISIQEGRRLLDYPDLEQMEKLANAAEERIFQILDKIVEEGEYTPPDPFMDLNLATQHVVSYINLYGQAGLEEEKMQLLRDFFSQVQAVKAAATPPAPPAATPNPPQAQPQPLPQSPLVPNANPQAS